MERFWSNLKLGQYFRSAMPRVSTWFGRERGSINVLYAIALIPMVGALGLATDAARGFLLKARLSQAIDQAVLAGGKVYFSPTRNDDVLKYFSANFPNTVTISFDTPFDAEFMDARVTLNAPTESGEAGSERLHMSGTATVPTTFTRVLTAFGCTSCDEITVVAEAEIERTIQALDAVISLDMSGSMRGSGKIGAARDGLLEFMESVYGPENNVSPKLTIEGTTYNLINIGFVVWNAKTNVTTNGEAFTGATTQPVASYTNPVTGAVSQSSVWVANNSEVPLIMDPRNTTAGGQLPGGWSGCVYARYVGGEATPGSQNSNTTSVNNNDADLVRGAQLDVGSGSKQKDWPGWEPMAKNEAEPRNGSWSNSEAGPGTRWTTSDWEERSCTLAYYTDFGSGSYATDGTVLLDNPNGTIKGSGQNTSRPVAVPAATAAIGSTYSGTMRFFNDNTRPYAVPAFGDEPFEHDCSRCLTRGIVPMTPNKLAIKSQISSIGNNEPDGNTNILQGLYWAWEVLMPGAPFDQGLVSTPFPRDRYIILVTDGAQVGGNGDAYKGRFGDGEIAGDNTDTAAHGMINAPDDSGDVAARNNNLDNRLRRLARNVKDEGIKLYVIGFDLADHPAELAMLNGIASPPDGDTRYFYAAETAEDLKNVLRQISSRLTDVRLSM